MSGDNAKKLNPEEMIIREAKADDYTEIMQLTPRELIGADYLAALYFTFLHHSTIRLYVGEYHGEIVFFTAVWVRDYDQDVTLMSMRVKETYRGNGLNTYAQKWIRHELQMNLGYQFYELRVEFLKEGTEDKEHKILRQWNRSHTIFSTETMSRAINEARAKLASINKPEQLNAQNTISQLTHKSTIDLLRADGDYMICYCHLYPLKISMRNLRLVAASNALIQFTLKSVGEMQQKHTKALSICHHMKSNESTMRAHIYFYGYSSEKPDTWVSHVFSYLEHLQGITGPRIQSYRLCFHFPKVLSVEKADSVLEPLLGPREETSPPWNVSCMVLKRSRYPIPPVKWNIGGTKL